MPATSAGMTTESSVSLTWERQMLEEFKKFALRGNAVDLAIGVIIGAAFGAIVNSLVGDILSPTIGAVAGGFDFSNYFTPLSSKVTADSLVEAKKQGAVLAWGNFVTIHHQLHHHRLDLVPRGQADESYAAVGAGEGAGIDETGDAAHGNSRSAQARAKGSR
jgi:large conductance mechanosensitive channel protein